MGKPVWYKPSLVLGLALEFLFMKQLLQEETYNLMPLLSPNHRKEHYFQESFVNAYLSCGDGVMAEMQKFSFERLRHN